MWQIIGQTRAVSLLECSLKGGSLAHAYLFAGPAHAGKMTLALNLAQAVNCDNTESPCGQCVSCQKVVSGHHPDVYIVGLSCQKEKPHVEIGIDQIRELQHSASLPPFEGKYKVFILDGAELLSIEAANSLLKTLEEPVGSVIFILLTTNEHLLPATVVSRCQRVEVFPLAIAEVETALSQKWGVELSRAKLLARLSRGLLGWAVSAILDDSLLRQRDEWLTELVDIVGGDYEERFACAAKLATEFSQNRGTVQDGLNLWLDWWRDLLLAKLGCSDLITNVDQLDTLSQITGSYSLAQIRVLINSIQAVKWQLKQNANPRLVLETLMLDIPGV
ncbi:ATP-binding protein [Chloroflexota bacterium]